MSKEILFQLSLLPEKRIYCSKCKIYLAEIIVIDNNKEIPYCKIHKPEGGYIF